MMRPFAPLIWSGFIPLMFCFPARGQTPLPVQKPVSAEPTLSVKDAVRLAVSRNPRLEATVRDIQAALSGVRSARALTNPTVLFTPGITSISGTGEEFIAQQPLEINGVRQARTAVANADLRGVRAQSLVALRDTIYQTKVFYYTLAQAQRQAQIARELLAVATEADRVARVQVAEGARAGIDLAQTGIEVSRSQREVTLAEGKVTEATAALNTLLARLPQDSLPTLDLSNTGTVPATPESAPVSNEPLFTQAFAIRGETQSAVALRDRFRAEASLARAEGRPDIAPQVRIGYFTRGRQPASDGNGVGIGIALTLPIFDYGSRRNRVRQAEDSARAQESRLIAAQNEIRQEIAQAQTRLAAANAVLANYQGGVLAQAKRLLEASQLGFREGRTSVVALLEAQRSYIGVQNEYAVALAEIATAHAAIERASGTIPDIFLPAPTP